jgi:uncharacterized membrane protein AbrB (regulator of aidB expression)
MGWLESAAVIASRMVGDKLSKTKGDQVMSIPVLVLFVVFFLFVGPVFLYWFSRNAKELLSKRPSFIGFPEDGRSDHDESEQRRVDVNRA